MPITYRIDEAAGIIYFVAVGTTTEQDWNERGLRVRADPAFKSGMSVLIDVRRHDSTLSTDFINRAAAGQRSRPGQPELPRWALVVSRPVSYGLGRMFSLLTESIPIEVKVFRDADDAEKWLKDANARREGSRETG